ncbi:MAG: hypothetical protein AAGC88_00285 [Bacteroidota bacterium]
MEPFEYVVVLTSLILGLGIAQILTSLADIVSNAKNVKLGVAHSFMVFVIFMNLIQEWWHSYQYTNTVEVWTLPLVLFLLVYPIFLFLLARMLFPTGIRGHETDLNAYYYDQWPWLFSIFLTIPIVSFFQNVFVSNLTVMSQVSQIILVLAYGAFLIFNIRNRIAHIIFTGAQSVAWIAFVFVDDSVL